MASAYGSAELQGQREGAPPPPCGCQGRVAIPATLSAKKVTLILPATGGNNGDMSQRVAFSARRVQEGGTPLLTLTFAPRFLRADANSPNFSPFFNTLKPCPARGLGI